MILLIINLVDVSFSQNFASGNLSFFQKKISKHNPFQVLKRPEWVTQDMLCLCVALPVPDSVAKQDDEKKHPVGKIIPVVYDFRVLLANLSLSYSPCQLSISQSFMIVVLS